MITTDKALSLANTLEDLLHDWIVANDAATELRRQHGEIEVLKRKTQELTAKNDGLLAQVDALSKPQEPVAYWIPKAEQFCIANGDRPFVRAWQPLFPGPKAMTRTSVPDIDYEALVEACYRLTGQPGGTRGCIQFSRGVEWFRSEILANIDAPLAVVLPDQSGARPDPCPGCQPGRVCKKPTCGRLTEVQPTKAGLKGGV